MNRAPYLLVPLLLVVAGCSEPQWRIDARNQIEQQRARATSSPASSGYAPPQPTGYIVRRQGVYVGNKTFEPDAAPKRTELSGNPDLSLTALSKTPPTKTGQRRLRQKGLLGS
jgi:hypothetical protein